MAKALFTPGPLNTSQTVKEVMLKDVGSRDAEFLDCVQCIRSQLLKIADCDSTEFATVPLQGSGTFAVEAVLATAIGKKKDASVLVLSNGAYGDRIAKICAKFEFDHDLYRIEETEVLTASGVEEFLSRSAKRYTLVCLVHCETSNGIVNPIETIVPAIKSVSPGSWVFLDAMSSFGAIPISLGATRVDFLVSSANKCLEGVPGFSFVLARRECLEMCEGRCPSMVLDLVDQWRGLELNRQFRFTPPTHSILAFRQALAEFWAEGGVAGRSRRYQANRAVLREGMKELGFRELLPDNNFYIITSYLMPADPRFDFADFYSRLSDLDQVIYPGKVTQAPCFRIGNIGHLQASHCHKLLEDIAVVLQEMGVSVPVQY